MEIEKRGAIETGENWQQTASLLITSNGLNLTLMGNLEKPPTIPQLFLSHCPPSGGSYHPGMVQQILHLSLYCWNVIRHAQENTRRQGTSHSVHVALAFAVTEKQELLCAVSPDGRQVIFPRAPLAKAAGKCRRLQAAQSLWSPQEPCVLSHLTRTQGTAKRGRSDWVF